MDNIYKNIEKYNPNKKRKILFIFMIRLLICLVVKNLIQEQLNHLLEKELNTRVTELFIGGKKLNISLVFITQS